MSSNSEARKRREEQPLTIVGHSQGNADIEVTPTDSDLVVTVMDYLRSEAGRLPNGTAARALAMMANTPFDSDQHDFGDETQSSVTKLDPDSSFATDIVTITISRKAAKKVADWPEDEQFPFSSEFGKACRAALEER